MGITEQTIVEQFPYWRQAVGAVEPPRPAPLTAFIGCGTSYNLALSLAALANAAGRPAIAVPGGEWLNRPEDYWPARDGLHVVALSRSGETTETVAAARASRAAGAFVTAITCEKQSAIAGACDRLLFAQTHPAEGIVMTSSASLMLLLGLQLIGYPVTPDAADAAETLLKAAEPRLAGLLAGRRHFVFLGGGALYGIALEAALKLMEMSQNFTQAFHPLEYRHGPISLVDEGTLAVMLYSAAQHDAEAKLVTELQQKGARVLGLGGPGDVSVPAKAAPATTGLVLLPTLQMLGERAAQARHIDTVAPRHLTKVVVLD